MYGTNLADKNLQNVVACPETSLIEQEPGAPQGLSAEVGR